MHTEFEAKFLGVDKDEMRRKLEEMSFKCVLPETLMKRKELSAPHMNKDQEWIRVRHEGDKVTLTYKFVGKEHTVDRVKEIEVTVSHFEDTVALLNKLNVNQFTYRENLREKWKKDDVEVVVDTWPGLRPYIEIEARSEDKVKIIAKSLGLDYKDALFGATSVAYEKELGMTLEEVINTSVITFDNPPKKKGC